MSSRTEARARGDVFYNASHPCTRHSTYVRYVSNGMCPVCARENKAASRLSTGEQEYPSPYYTGRNARGKGRAKTPPATLTWAERHWWLGGWNDRDMEMAR